jgi:hypothetical protein
MEVKELEELRNNIVSFCQADKSAQEFTQKASTFAQKVKSYVQSKNMTEEDCKRLFESQEIINHVSEKLQMYGEQDRLNKFADMAQRIAHAEKDVKIICC